MGKLINNRLTTLPALYPDNIISSFFSYMPESEHTRIPDDECWLENFAANECSGNIQIVINKERDGYSDLILCAEYPEDLALFVMRAEIRKQQYG